MVSLSRYLGDQDIQLSAIPDTVLCGLKPPERMISMGLTDLSVRQRLSLLNKNTKFKVIAENVKRQFRKNLSMTPQHPKAAEIKAFFPSEWASYKKFCVVRNPWTKTLSDYRWRTRKLKHPPSFKSYVLALQNGDDLDGIVPKNHDNWEMYTIENRVVVDHAINFDFLKDELGSVLSECGITWDGWLPKMKQAKQLSIENSGFDSDTIEAIANLYQREIAHFNFTFSGKI